jgi:cholera toxin transcriptional activator
LRHGNPRGAPAESPLVLQCHTTQKGKVTSPSSSTSTGSAFVRFGEFRLDRCVGELHRDGAKKIRLPEQPFQILCMLLERSGEVVTREEIRKLLWPDNTIVEFEHSISAAMNRLRQALGDSAATPRFIDTLPRWGYRFLVPTTQHETALIIAAEDAASVANQRFVSCR